MTDIFDDEQILSDESLARVANLAQYQFELEHQIDKAEEALKELKKKHRMVSQVDLPELMESLSLASFKTNDGKKVDIRENFYASIAKDRKMRAANWLIENGQDALVKRDVHIPFQAGDAEMVAELCQLLEANGFPHFSVDFLMNTNSVKSALKELIASGEDVPFDLFGLRRVIEAKISL
jgi:hypothetical protein